MPFVGESETHITSYSFRQRPPRLRVTDLCDQVLRWTFVSVFDRSEIPSSEFKVNTGQSSIVRFSNRGLPSLDLRSCRLIEAQDLSKF